MCFFSGMVTVRNQDLVIGNIVVIIKASPNGDKIVFFIEISPHCDRIVRKLFSVDGGGQMDVDRRAVDHALSGDLEVNKLFSLSILVKMSSYPKGRNYYEDNGEDATKFVRTMKDVLDAGAFVSELQVFTSKKNDYLLLGWMKWQYDPVSTVEG